MHAVMTNAPELGLHDINLIITNDRRPHILCSIFGRPFGDFKKDARLFSYFLMGVLLTCFAYLQPFALQPRCHGTLTWKKRFVVQHEELNIRRQHS